ncbi:ATP-dependent DNA ligase Cdc17 [Coemansia spiralis]|uniref:DNA ligase 1 n=2 Tax=Coemansia TaxID=4863 RepID=A0A9W8FX45_9FUNG|nr:ATP-dependent DNA ligase Cdc17 [Coemansia umbellata]KAJ2668930.1 ATP-dependent DNA ligase Cdc17 [Coemansia spiralis]
MKQKSLASFFGSGSAKGKSNLSSSKNESKAVIVNECERAASEKTISDEHKINKKAVAIDDKIDASPNLKEAVITNSGDQIEVETQKVADDERSDMGIDKDSDYDSISKGNLLSRKRRTIISDDGSTGLSNEEAEDVQAQSESEISEEEAVIAQAAMKDLNKLPKPAAKRAKKAKEKEAVELAMLDSIELLDTKEGKQIPFLALCKVFELIEGTTKRLEITSYIRAFFLQVMRIDQHQLAHTVMLCITKLAPDHEGIELGIGESVLVKAIAAATGKQVNRVKQDHHELGDLGVVAQRGKANQRTMFKPKPLSISKVFTTFKEIALTTGSSSIQKKSGLITGLLASCSDIEARYLIRSLEDRLRIGLAESTVQTALAQAALLYEKGEDADLGPADFQQATEGLKQVMSEFPIYDRIIDVIYKYGISDISNHCMLTPTLPVKPMLAKIEKAADDILRRFEGKPFTCEFKYDGERSQIHYVQESDGSTKCVIFSRNAENNTGKYPDIASAVKQFAKPNVTSFILDCEAVAWDVINGKIRSFQTLSSRKRKVENESEITIGVCCFAFDLLYLNGEPLIRMPLRKRRELLHENFTPVENKFQFATSKDLTEVEDIQDFLELSVKENCEGLMIKTLDGDSSSYEPSKRSMNWLKLKKDYVDGLGDSLDLVVIGAYFGKGKRVGAYGAYLLACYDPDREEYQAICKIGTGFSDADLEAHKAQLDQNRIELPKPYYAVSEKTKPDIWFEPAQVWEVKAADLSLSPIYQAAFGEIDENKGVSLRFPRFIRVREDKASEMATSSSQVAEMYENQKINH